MEDSTYSDKRTRTFVKFLSIQCKKKTDENFVDFLWGVESFKYIYIYSSKALEAFIQTQRTLLARQKSDIERLRQLRIDIAQKPTQVLSNLSNEVCCSLF